LKRSIALILCCCLVGVTAMPAFALPCCCKGLAKHAVVEKPRPCCESKSPQDPGSNSKKMRPCCATGSGHVGPVSSSDSASDRSCCSGNTIKKECRVCRCLEQMQIVALSGTVTPESDIRNSIGVPVISTVFSSPDVAYVSTAVASSDCRGAPIGLRTCTLRC
jgi:hypothetical protein